MKVNMPTDTSEVAAASRHYRAAVREGRLPVLAGALDDRVNTAEAELRAAKAARKAQAQREQAERDAEIDRQVAAHGRSLSSRLSSGHGATGEVNDDPVHPAPVAVVDMWAKALGDVQRRQFGSVADAPAAVPPTPSLGIGVTPAPAPDAHGWDSAFSSAHARTAAERGQAGAGEGGASAGWDAAFAKVRERR